MLAGLSSERNLRSKIWWFTEFCNSHYVSHFAAFFIVAGTKISIANSCSEFRISFQRKETVFKFLLSFVNKIQDPARASACQIRGNPPSGGLPIHYLRSYCKQLKQWLVYGKMHRVLKRKIRVNDPSAGSPTETLLRLLLPLNDQVWPPSRMWLEVANELQQSRGLTKPFNR